MSEYKYKDEKKALQILDTYSREHELILVPQDEKLFRDLSTLKNDEHHITIPNLNNAYGYEKDTRANIHQILFIIQRLHDKISGTKTREDAATNGVQISVTKSNKNMTIDITRATGTVPILIKQSFFPDWKRTDGAPIYITAPSYSVTYATSSFTMTFQKSRLRNIAEILSLLGILGLLFI